MLIELKTKIKIKIFKMMDKIYYFISLYNSYVKDKGVNIHHTTYGYTKKTFKLYRKDDYIKIGKYCSIADDVVMIASGEHNVKHISTYPFYDRDKSIKEYKDTFSKGSIIIKNDVWIGYGATILSGVTIGNGAVIAANSLVNSNIPDYAIVAGIPAKIIKYRFRNDEIASLLKIQWWNFDENYIEKNKNDFYLPIDEFIRKYNGDRK